jgi:Acetyl-CoA acetyltransferase
MQDVFIFDGIRTPIGRYAGGLSSIRTDDLAALPIQYLKQQHPNLPWTEVDEVILGVPTKRVKTIVTWHGWQACLPVYLTVYLPLP